MYYDNLYSSNNSKLTNKLFDVNKQIASGLSIEYASDDVAVFSETMRLDNEIVSLGHIKESTESGYKISNQTDVVLNDFEDSLSRMQTLLNTSANGTNNESSLSAIAEEMRGLESHLKSLANTSINGQFLFAGSAVDVKPINEDGSYNGNAEDRKAFSGSHEAQTYNLSGAELFLGEEKSTRREVTTNVNNSNLIAQYESLQGEEYTTSGSLSENSTIRELMGDTDDTSDPANDHYFYIRGVKHNGEAFNSRIELHDEDKVKELLRDIGEAYGNTSRNSVVNVSMNSNGQIVIEDKQKGSSKLDFHMVGAVDFAGNGDAKVTDIDDLDDGETDFDAIMNPTVTPQLYVKEFVKSGFTQADTVSDADNNIEALLYDRTAFSKNGSTLSSNVAQIKKDDNAFATSSTKISEVADLSQGTEDTLDGTKFIYAGKNINGDDYSVEIDLASSGSTFTIDGTTYDIYNASNPRSAVEADAMTYQQLMDVMNMVVTDTLPDGDSAEDYDKAIYDSRFIGETYLSDDGKIIFEEHKKGNTKATMALYDNNSGKFSDTGDQDSSVLSFNANNALTISDPKTNFFKTIDEAIKAIEEGKLYPNTDEGTSMRNIGIENSMSAIENLQDHVARSHAKVGAQSNALNKTVERTELLEVSTISLRSSIVDTDLAEASLSLTQLNTTYEAMLSTVGKVSKLSLVNYL
jgi:flagellar hook-associated protein 3 FlgL